jgi:hypothetical protein
MLEVGKANNRRIPKTIAEGHPRSRLRSKREMCRNKTEQFFIQVWPLASTLDLDRQQMMKVRHQLQRSHIQEVGANNRRCSMYVISNPIGRCSIVLETKAVHRSSYHFWNITAIRYPRPHMCIRCQRHDGVERGLKPQKTKALIHWFLPHCFLLTGIGKCS